MQQQQPSNGGHATGKSVREMLHDHHDQKLDDLQTGVRDLKHYIDVRIITVLVLLISQPDDVGRRPARLDPQIGGDMATPYFGNPTEGGRIQMENEVWDKKSIRVTRGCAGHQAAGQGCSVDLGDGTAERWCIAARDGTVLPRDASQVLQGIVRIDYGDGWGGAYAHMFPVLVKGGDRVAMGQRVGQVGDAHDPTLGPMFPHLHYDVLHNGAQQDPVGYLNMPPPPPPSTGGDMLQGTNPKQMNNKTVTVTGDSTRMRAAPAAGTTPVLAVYGAGTVFTPDWEVTGQAPAAGASAQWYGGWGKTAKGLEFGYLHVSVVTPPAPFETAGHTDQELKSAGDAGYNAGRSAVQAAAAGVPPK